MKVLIVDNHRQRSATVEAVLTQAGFVILGFVSETAAIHPHIRRLQPDAVIVAAEVPAREMLDQLAPIARLTPGPLLLLAAQADRRTIAEAVDAGLSCYVVPQLSPEALTSLVVTAVAQFRSTRQLQRDLDVARQRMEERRIVDLAKCRLMEREGLAEASAYRQLQRLAMDRNLRMVEVARSVLAG